jgi:hypothetical protein
MIVAILSLGSVAAANSPCNPCNNAGNMVEKTIMCPEWTTETRIVKETKYRNEERTKECTVYTKQNVEKKVCCPITVWVKKDMVEVQEYEVSIPTYELVDEEYTEMVDGTLDITTYKTVSKCVPVTKTKTVCVCEPQWVEREVEYCGPCGTKCVKKVTCYEPKMVEKQVEYTCTETVCEKVPCVRTIDTCEPVTKVRKVKRIVNKIETRTHESKYVTYEPLQKFERKTVCVCECVPETKTVTETVCVPYEVEKEVEVRVCKLVPKTIQVPCNCQ